MNIIFFDELPSTNLFVKENFDNLNNFDVVVAKKQTSGYGRFKRNWVDLGSENIFMSICLKFDNFDEKFACLTQFASLILANQMKTLGLFPNIKWPNDILIDGKKVSGILAESVIKNSQIKGIVLGLGINLNASLSDLSKIDKKATALNLELGENVSYNSFINDFCASFELKYKDFINSGFISIKEDYKSFLNCLGQQISVTYPNKVISGIAKDVTDDGLLILEHNNELINLSTGDLN